ncbi:MAG: hypothetical protein IJD70_03415 [Clostridia bacterium]|nr:hypothetical protein [Clostridia bacterium]
MPNEKMKKKASLTPELSLSEKKDAQKALKKRKKFEKKELKRLKKEHKRRSAILPPSKRPIICPPDCSDAANKHVVIGIALRVLIILVAVIGVAMFVSEAFGFDMTQGYLTEKKIEDYAGVTAGTGFSFIARWALLFVGALALCSLWKYGKFIGIPVIIAAILIPTLPNPIQYIYEAVLTAYNGALGHMKYMGFFAMEINQISVTHTMGTPEELVRTAVALFTLLTALIFVPSLIKRTRIILPGIFSAALMILIFVYNLSRSNWALALIAASFCGLIVMYVYDRIYIAAPKPNETDETGNIFGEVEEPALPERLLNKKAEKEAKAEAKKAKKAEKKARKEGKRITVDQEISEYFADSKPARAKKVKLTPEQKKEAELAKKEARAEMREQKLEERRALAALHKHRLNILLRRASIGGFAGAGIMLLSLVILAVPAMSTKGSFETIPAIDEKLEYYREYVTALLMGDDPALDLLAFEGDANNFSPRTTMASPRYYTYEPLMTVESNFSSNIYLRGWIATDYVDGVWMTADPKSEALEKYRSLFATNDDASESIYYNFFKVMTDDGVFEDDRDVTELIKRLDKYGYTIAQVNIKREEDFSDVILYMPSYHIRKYCPYGTSSTGNATNFLRQYGLSEASEISYANYFDGLYTSYRVTKNGTDGYAAVAMLTNMRYDNFHYNVANLIAEYNQTRLALTNGKTVVEKNASDERLGKFSVTLYDGTVVEYEVISVAEDGTKILHIKQPVGTAVYTIAPDGTVKRDMIDTPIEYDQDGNLIQYYAPKLDRTIVYFEALDSTAQWQFNRQATLLDKYTPFVYETYTKKSGSAIISDLYREIIENAVVKEEHKDPVPADFSLAANKSEYKYNKNKETYSFVSAVTDRNVYVQRHELVMEIINYLCDDEKFTYTLYPTVPGEENTLDGIETFLTVTHEGYCVQFASSLALLLREAGIPARYVEGYIASGMRNNRGEEAVSRFKTTVRDADAHAWVEVWFDGIGWVQYEATPEYYDAMYVNRSGSQGSVTRPITPPDDSEEDPEEEPDDEFGGLTDYEIEQMLEEQRREALRALIKKIIIISAISLAVITAITVFFAIVLKRAKKSRREREEILSELHNTDVKKGIVPDREKVRRTGEMIMNLLRECGFTPQNGEFSSDFAARVAAECERELAVAAPEENLTEFEAPRHPLREAEVVRIFEAIAAEEFGNGAPARELPGMARLYYRLHSTLYRRKVNPWRRMVLYLFKRES